MACCVTFCLTIGLDSDSLLEVIKDIKLTNIKSKCQSQIVDNEQLCVKR